MDRQEHRPIRFVGFLIWSIGRIVSEVGITKLGCQRMALMLITCSQIRRFAAKNGKIALRELVYYFTHLFSSLSFELHSQLMDNKQGILSMDQVVRIQKRLWIQRLKMKLGLLTPIHWRIITSPISLPIIAWVVLVCKLHRSGQVFACHCWLLYFVFPHLLASSYILHMLSSRHCFGSRRGLAGTTQHGWDIILMKSITSFAVELNAAANSMLVQRTARRRIQHKRVIIGRNIETKRPPARQHLLFTIILSTLPFTREHV